MSMCVFLDTHCKIKPLIFSKKAMLKVFKVNQPKVWLALCLGATSVTFALPALAQSLAETTIAQDPPAPVTPSADPSPESPSPELESEASPEPSPEQTFVTVCAYDPNGGAQNPLGMRAFITVSEVEGNSVFLYEQFPSFVTAPNDAQRRSDVASERTLTLYDTSIAEARQLVVDNPDYYAALLGLVSADDIAEGQGFDAVNTTLACQEVSDGAIAGVPQPPDNPAPPIEGIPPEPAEPAEPATTFADLPNGNYRLVSAQFPNRVVSDEELIESGGAMFLFRKFGDAVIGSYSFIDHEGGSCIAGTIEGNTVTGQSYAAGDSLRSGTFLTLGENVADNRYEGSVLTLAGFSRINAGTRLPVESCQ